MAANFSSFSKTGLIALIQCYRYTISLLIGPCCRFEPSCSVYAIEAIKRHGTLKGSYFMLRRLLRCHPWHPGGVDQVPIPQKLKTIC